MRSILTSDLVQMMPTLVRSASSASSNTALTLSSVAARLMLQTTKISSHSRKKLSVTFLLAELRSPRPDPSNLVSRAALQTTDNEKYTPGRSARIRPLLRMCALIKTLDIIS